MAFIKKKVMVMIKKSVIKADKIRFRKYFSMASPFKR